MFVSHRHRRFVGWGVLVIALMVFMALMALETPSRQAGSTGIDTPVGASVSSPLPVQFFQQFDREKAAAPVETQPDPF